MSSACNGSTDGCVFCVVVEPHPAASARPLLRDAAASSGHILPPSRRTTGIWHRGVRDSLTRQMSYPFSASLLYAGWQRTSAAGITSAHECSLVVPLHIECLWTPMWIVLGSRFQKQCAADSTQSFATNVPPQKPELLVSIDPYIRERNGYWNCGTAVPPIMRVIGLHPVVSFCDRSCAVALAVASMASAHARIVFVAVGAGATPSGQTAAGEHTKRRPSARRSAEQGAPTRKRATRAQPGAQP